ncbi:hypothetical protein ABTK22_19335, partial [Acinetobacter baumannii]
VRGQGAVTGYGDAGSYFATALVGKNFADGRGNVAVNFEYARQNTLYASERAYSAQQDGLVATDSDAFKSNLVNGSDGIPDTTFLRNI